MVDTCVVWLKIQFLSLIMMIVLVAVQEISIAPTMWFKVFNYTKQYVYLNRDYH